MACEYTYFIGQGPMDAAKLNDNCGAATEAFFALGDVMSFIVNPTPSYESHQESVSGLSLTSQRWQSGLDVTFTAAIKSWSAKNLASFLQGTDSGSVVAGSVVDEAITVPSAGRVYTEYQGISSVVVTTAGSPPTTLTLNTHYTVDARTGRLTFTDAGYSASGGAILVDYDHVGRNFKVNAMKNPLPEFKLRFNGVNRASPNTPVTVHVPRVQIGVAENLAFISDEMFTLDITGQILPDANNDFFYVEEANQYTA